MSGRKNKIDTTNMSFKKIVHVIEDELHLVEQELDKGNYDTFRKQQETYILAGIKEWEEKHKKMVAGKKV